MNKLKDYLKYVLEFRLKWLWVVIPFSLSFLILGPLSEIPAYLRFAHELGIVFSNVLLSISAAGVFYFVIEFVPKQNRIKESKELMIKHVEFLDDIIFQHIKNIGEFPKHNSLNDFLGQEKILVSSFLRIDLSKSDYSITIPGSKSRGKDNFCALLVASTNRVEDIKDIFLFSSEIYPIKAYENINRVLWFQSMLTQTQGKGDYAKQLAFELVSYYLKFKAEIRKYL